jgi:hypothetical protein
MQQPIDGHLDLCCTCFFNRWMLFLTRFLSRFVLASSKGSYRADRPVGRLGFSSFFFFSPFPALSLALSQSLILTFEPHIILLGAGGGSHSKVEGKPSRCGQEL